MAVTAVVPPPASEPFSITIDGMTIPFVTCALGALGVAAARPLAASKETALSRSHQWLVSAIMLVITELWIIQSRPGWLFAFVVALGLGFAGYSLIELLGDQVKDLVRSAFTAAKGAIGRLTGQSTKGDG